MMLFADRVQAGQQLAERLQQYHNQAVVFALPRGGVETGVEVARLLDVPLSLVIARKIGHPYSTEFAVCAVTETGPLTCDETERALLDPSWLKKAEADERAEAKRRRTVYLAKRPVMSARGKVAIVVDDGIATGLTIRAAVADLKAQRPSKLIVAVPCAPRDAVDDLLKLADDVIVLTDPDEYAGAVGAYYEWFPQLSDKEVTALMNGTAGTVPPKPTE